MCELIIALGKRSFIESVNELRGSGGLVQITEHI